MTCFTAKNPQYTRATASTVHSYSGRMWSRTMQAQPAAVPVAPIQMSYMAAGWPVPPGGGGVSLAIGSACWFGQICATFVCYVPRWNWKCVSLGRWIIRLYCASLFRSFQKNMSFGMFYLSSQVEVNMTSAVPWINRSCFHVIPYEILECWLLRPFSQYPFLSMKKIQGSKPRIGLMVPITPPE